MRKTKRKPLPLWFITVLTSGGILLASFLITALFALLSHHFGWLAGRSPLIGLLSFLSISMGIGLVLSTIISRRFLRPIVELIQATKEVAQGHFDIQLKEGGRSEMDELIHNFNVMTKELSQTEMLRSDFVNNISHEIKTPVAAIESCATMLQSGTLSPQEQHDYAGMIAQNARRLSTLSRNVLSLSRLEHQEIAPKSASFRLDEQIRQTIVLLEPKWSQKQLLLDIDFPEMTYVGNQELLMLVWFNLLENAIKFSNDGGKLQVRLGAEAEEVRVDIQDDGVGMSPEAVQRVFEKFYQGDASRASQGNGLGLSLVKRIVELYAGRIQVQSASGEGSTFTVYLPGTATQK